MFSQMTLCITLACIFFTLLGAVGGFILGASNAAGKACRFTHDWKNLGSRVGQRHTTTKQKCATCGKTREQTFHAPPHT